MAVPKKLNKMNLKRVKRNLKRINKSNRKRRNFLNRAEKNNIVRGGTCCPGPNNVECPPGYTCNAKCKCVKTEDLEKYSIRRR